MKTKSKDKTKTKLFVVDTIITFRHRYVIEAREVEHAYDEVVMNEAATGNDFFEAVTQRFLGETIIDGREISKKEFDKMLPTLAADEKELSSHWMGDKLIRKINYDK